MIRTFLLVFVLSQSQIQTPQPAPPPSITDFVFVSASLIDLPRSRVTDSVDVIGRVDIRARQHETVADALRSVTGLGITSSGGRGAVASLFTRGGESDYTLVLVDGIPINEFGGSIDLAHLSPAGIDRIEIVRGPQGALHGSGAIAGVVQIVSAEGGPGAASAQLEIGSEDLRRAAADGRGSARGWSFGGGADLLTDHGAVENDDYARVELSGVLSRAFGDRGRLRGTARWTDYERGFPGPFGSNPVGNFTGIDTVSRGENDAIATGISFDGTTGAVSHRITASWFRTTGAFVSVFSPDDPSHSSSRRAAGRYIADLQAGSLGVSAGADIARESARNTFIVDDTGTEVPIERTLAGYFAEARGSRGSRVLFTAGVRLDQITGDETIWSFNPRVSAVIYLTRATARATTRLRGGFSTGIKPPSAFELSSTDNPALKPERNRSGEIALEQSFANGVFQMAATAFWNRYDDLIITVGRSLAGASQYRSDNLSNSRARGMEFAASGRFANGLAMRGGYTWLDTDILAADGVSETGLSPFVPGDRLLRRPRHRGFVDVSFATASMSTFVNVDARGGTLDIEPSYGLFGGLFENDGYATASAGASWKLGHRVEVFGRVTNLFDRGYEEIFGFPAPGRRVAGGLRVAAGR